jgi:hypothetical protein
VILGNKPFPRHVCVLRILASIPRTCIVVEPSYIDIVDADTASQGSLGTDRPLSGRFAMFFLTEIELAFSDRRILVANVANDQPLSTQNSPYQILFPNEKRLASFEVGLFWLLSYSYSYSYSMKWYSYSEIPHRVRVPLTLMTSTKKPGKTWNETPRYTTSAISKRVSWVKTVKAIHDSKVPSPK